MPLHLPPYQSPSVLRPQPLCPCKCLSASLPLLQSLPWLQLLRLPHWCCPPQQAMALNIRPPTLNQASKRGLSQRVCMPHWEAFSMQALARLPRHHAAFASSVLRQPAVLSSPRAPHPDIGSEERCTPQHFHPSHTSSARGPVGGASPCTHPTASHCPCARPVSHPRPSPPHGPSPCAWPQRPHHPPARLHGTWGGPRSQPGSRARPSASPCTSSCGCPGTSGTARWLSTPLCYLAAR